MAVRVATGDRMPEPGYFGSEYAGIARLASTAEDLEVPTNHLIMLTQVRAELSPDHEALKESIRSKGIYHPVSVARMDDERLGGYVSFVNELWGAEHHLGDFLPAADGYFYLVIAGHSRTVAAKELAAERGEVLAVPSRIYSSMSNQDIIAHQIEENIHSNPSPERQAMAIVESYYMGQREGLWNNKTEFVSSADNKFSRYALNQALVFADLPGNIRDFVFAGTFPYSSAVELGRALKTAEKYFVGKYPDSSAEEQQAVVSDWLQVIMARIHQKKLGGSAARHFIHANARGLETSLAEQESKGNMTMFALELVDERDTIRSELKELLRALGELPMRQHARAISLHLRAFPGEEGEELRTELIKNGSTYLGTISLNGAAELSDGMSTLSLAEAG